MNYPDSAIEKRGVNRHKLARITVAHEHVVKTVGALCGQAYSSVKFNADNYRPTIVFGYYDERLRTRGWKFIGRSDLWGNEFPKNSIYAYYQKGEYCAYLEYFSAFEGTDWRYIFGVNWNEGSCDKYK